MLVPGTGIAHQNQEPKLIGQLDLHSEERHARYIAIGGSIVGIFIVATLVYALFFHNAWERDNGARLLSLKTEADALVQAMEYEKAKARYNNLFALLADRVVTGESLRAETESARLALTENNKKVEAILAARAEAAEQQKQRRDAQEEAIEAVRRPKERHYRDSHGAVVSETETENKLRQVRSKISSMPDNAERAYMEGVLQALEDEWARIKQQGPIDR